MGNMVNVVNDNVRGYIESTNQFFKDKYISDEAIARIKDTYLRAGQTTNLDVITYMSDPTYSKPLMQRYIMSHPTNYNLAKNNHINGFNETLNLDDRSNPEDNEDYLKVTDGWIMTDSLNEYPIEFINTEPELSIGEQLAIIDTWDECAALIAAGIDFSEEIK